MYYVIKKKNKKHYIQKIKTYIHLNANIQKARLYENHNQAITSLRRMFNNPNKLGSNIKDCSVHEFEVREVELSLVK